MKKLLIIAIAFIVVSCSPDFGDMNTDVKSATQVSGETLFSNAQKNLTDQIASINVNYNNFKLWAQYATETTYTDEANFDIVNRTVPDNAWGVYYRDVLKDLNEAKNVISAEELTLASDKAAQANKIAIIDLVRSYTYYRMVTLWGDIPYSDALNNDINAPKYDDALGIYKDLLTNIANDLSAMDASFGSFDNSSDLVYDGDVAAWVKFAKSLQIKIAITLADVASESSLVQSTIEGAYAGAFSSNADNAAFSYLDASPNTNPLWVSLVASGRSDYVITNTIGDKMNTLNDPRKALYFKDLDASGNVIGATYGASSAYPSYSHFGTALEVPTFEATWLSYSEVQFYLAEAAERGFNVGTAVTHYNQGVTASIEYWGGSADDASDYLAQATVAYATAAATWQEKIATQAWISFFNRGFEGWTEYRRLDYPVLPMPKNAVTTSYPNRYTYPINEQTLNGANYKAAAAKVGGDELTTKLFWDKN